MDYLRRRQDPPALALLAEVTTQARAESHLHLTTASDLQPKIFGVPMGLTALVLQAAAMTHQQAKSLLLLATGLVSPLET